MVFNIETRKVQQTGGSSFIISLPKGWINEHNIRKNDSLGIITQPDGNLLITPFYNSEDLIKQKEIIVDDIKEYNYLFRLLIGAYIMGYSSIILKSSHKFERWVRDCIKKFTQVAIKPEILEETNTFIRIKDLLDPKEMPFDTTIRRMYNIASDMHSDAIKALKSKKKGLAEEVINRDNDVDRLHWLIGRQSSLALNDILLCQKMGVTLQLAVQYHQISRFLERIGDHAVKIAQNILRIIDNKISDDLIEEISKASSIALKLLDQALDAYRLNDINFANDTIESTQELVEACEQISGNPPNGDIPTSIAISYIAESIRRTGEYAADIAEIMINKLIDEKNNFSR